ncbi:hypothetical protein MUK42_12845 [Musa troglodytarum]|uniref:Uncharacterized protein n=1 Tax=Musa troglodytarum TaxID=320322 RepID=A0A9E7GK72_9LILI|nr:hypothetical protein MUK42_12845 [Musa troglodytarum]
MAISASASAYVGARIKVEEEVVRRVKVEEEVDGEEFGDGDNSNNHYQNQPQPEEEEEERGPAERIDSLAAEKAAEQLLMTRPWKRRRAVGQLGPKPLLSQNRHRLSRLLDRLARAHSWKEASGTLSSLLKGTPRASTLLEDRRNFLVAMEIQRRLGGKGGNYQTKIKKIYEVWMSKLVWTKKCSKKRYTIQLELALFYLSHGNIEEAFNTTKFLVQYHDSASEPIVNLIHGLILYQMWYSGLPEGMKIKDFDLQMASEALDATSCDGYEGPEIFASSNGHNAINTEDVNYSARVASQSSVGNEKNKFDLKIEISTYADMVVASHWLHAIGCVLLLLGDRVDDALMELENSCHNFSVALPFRLRARILEAFRSSQLTAIHRMWEQSLEQGPGRCDGLQWQKEVVVKRKRWLECWNDSWQQLLQGNYDTVPLLEMITLHLDATDGRSSIWEEFASCFLKILTSSVADYEDRVSVNRQGGSAAIVSSNKIPRVFTEGQSRESWKVRCRWWITRHFSKNAYLQDMQYSDRKLLATKAACASHIYGPNFEYVKAAFSSLTNEANNVQLSFLQAHMEKSLRLHENLTALGPL